MKHTLTSHEKILLEQNTLLQIQQSLEKDDSRMISLVKFSKNNDLFFPQIYEMWFVTKLTWCIAELKDFSALDDYKIFGLNAKEVGIIYADNFNTLIGKIKKSATSADTSSLIHKTIYSYLDRVLDTGVFFETSFFESNAITKVIVQTMEPLKKKNSENAAKFLEDTLEEKSGTNTIRKL